MNEFDKEKSENIAENNNISADKSVNADCSADKNTDSFDTTSQSAQSINNAENTAKSGTSAENSGFADANENGSANENSAENTNSADATRSFTPPNQQEQASQQNAQNQQQSAQSAQSAQYNQYQQAQQYQQYQQYQRYKQYQQAQQYQQYRARQAQNAQQAYTNYANNGNTNNAGGANGTNNTYGYNQAPNPNAYAYAAQNTAKGGKKKGRKGLMVFSAVLAVAVLISFGTFIGYIAGGNTDLKNDKSQNDFGNNSGTVVIEQGTVPQKDGVKPDSDGKYTADGVAKLVSDSVVNITVYNDAGTGSAIASGVIIDKEGYIVSNDHIYSDVSNAKFVITMNDGSSYKASYVAGDTRSDLCVLKMEGAKDLTPAVFADSTKLSSGDEVIAIGSPYGLSGTVTKGIVSAPSRRITFTSTHDGESVNYSMRVIQTDTALNSGNSGGALVNMYGQVVGISSSKIVSSGYEGLCFAIPANDAVKTVKSLIANKKVVGRARLGIMYNEVTAAAGIVNNIPSGLMIQSIDIDSNLYSSGLKKGDIITEMNGKKVTSADIALDVIDDSKAGDKITAKVYIASTKQYKTVTAVLLEDKSVSSYTTQEKQQTTTAKNFDLW